nr:intraflagellar transport-associated protein isoform X5 [Manis javanica]
MTAQASELEIMDEDRLVEEVLDKFVNCHEQTYEEFLSTFTHLSKGKMESRLAAASGRSGTASKCPCAFLRSFRGPACYAWSQAKACCKRSRQTNGQVYCRMSLASDTCLDIFRQKILGDEVQPFSLDEEFDYDTVLLTPKFTPAETDAIKELSKQKRKNTDAGVEEPCD